MNTTIKPDEAAAAAAAPKRGEDLGTLSLKEVKLALHGDASEYKPERVPTWGSETPEERAAKGARIRDARNRTLSKAGVLWDVARNAAVLVVVTAAVRRLLARVGAPDALKALASPLAALAVLMFKSRARYSHVPAKFIRRDVFNIYPILGALPMMMANMDDAANFMPKQNERCGFEPVVVPVPFANFVSLLDVRDREFALRVHPSKFPKNLPEDKGSFEFIFGSLLGRGIFAVDGEEWLDQRKIAAPLFSGANMINVMEKTFNSHGRHCADLLLDIARQPDRVVDLQELWQAAVFDGFTEIAFSLSLDNVGTWARDGTKSALLKSFDRAQVLASKRFSIPPLVWHLSRLVSTLTGVGEEAELERHIRVLDESIDRVVQERLARPASASEGAAEGAAARDLLDMYVDYAKRTGQTHLLDRDAILAMLKNFFVAGRDTTSCLLTHLFAKLTPHALAQLQEELKPYGDYLSLEDSKKLVYTNAVINEALRMGPPVGTDFRLCAEDMVLPSGMPVRRGDRLAISNVSIGRDPKLWSKPNEFIPERWIKFDAEGKPLVPRRVDEFVHPVFFAGPRTCLGKDMARFEAAVFLAQIVNRVRIDVVPGQDTDSVVTAPAIFLKYGLRVRPAVL